MTRMRRTTPHLFQHWKRIAEKIQGNRRLILFIDFDGTLVRIAPLPSGVRLTNGVSRALRKLAVRRRITLVVISGRRRSELLRYIGIPRIRYLGLYGWERGKKARLPTAAQGNLDRALAQLRRDLRAFPGVWIEAKDASFSVHLLGTSTKIQRRVRRLVRTRLKPMSDSLRLMNNLRDIEVAPVSIGHKGVGVRRILEEQALHGALPIYFGDDLSDEPAFAATRKGIPILVGKRRPTRAQFFLRGPAEVATALTRMEALLR